MGGRPLDYVSTDVNSRSAHKVFWFDPEIIYPLQGWPAITLFYF